MHNKKQKQMGKLQSCFIYLSPSHNNSYLKAPNKEDLP